MDALLGEHGKSRMTVLILCQLFPPLIYGGGEVLLWNLAKWLVSRGHEVHVITQRVRGREDSEVSSGVSIRRVGKASRYTGELTTSVTESLTYLLEAIPIGLDIIRHNRVDIVHSNTYVPVFAGQICAAIFRKKHVITIHDIYLAAIPGFWTRWSRQANVGLLARFFGPSLEGLILRMPAIVHTVSKTSRDDLVTAGVNGQRIVVVPNGIDRGEFADNHVRVDDHQAIFIGRLVFYKNLETVFRAFAKVIQVIPDAKLIVVGDGPMRTTWEEAVEELGIRRYVRFCGLVSHERKLNLLKRSAFLVQPSTVEGFGIVVLEAFACKKPVLASDIGALREIISDGSDGFLINPMSEHEWASKMILLFKERKETHKMGARGRNKVSNYTIEEVGQRMEELYYAALKR